MASSVAMIAATRAGEEENVVTVMEARVAMTSVMLAAAKVVAEAAMGEVRLAVVIVVVSVEEVPKEDGMVVAEMAWVAKAAEEAMEAPQAATMRVPQAAAVEAPQAAAME